MDNKSYTIRVPKRWVRIALIVGVTTLVVAPLAAVATHSFTDVPNDHTFHDDIAWLRDADVTRGCNPPANDRYCPDDAVTRDQMAAFMRRLAENRVVDAATLEGMTADEIIAGGPGVEVFEFTVSADDWGTNLHYGSSNIFRRFDIPAEATGGVPLSSFFNDGGTVLLYTNAHHGDLAGSLGGWHTTPYLYQIGSVGLKTMLLPSRGSVVITETTGGWDHNSIADEELPETIEYRIVMISP